MPKSKPPQTPIELLAIKFDRNKKTIKSLEEENKALRVPLEEHLSNRGEVLEGSGHRVCLLEHAGAQITLKYTHKVTAVLQPDAIDILKKHGHKEAIELVETVREDVIERLYQEGKITDAEMKELYVSKASDAFSVTVKDKFKETEVL